MKVIRLTEGDIQRIVKRVLNEQKTRYDTKNPYDTNTKEDTSNSFCLNIQTKWRDKADKFLENVVGKEKGYNTVEELCSKDMEKNKKEMDRLKIKYNTY